MATPSTDRPRASSSVAREFEPIPLAESLYLDLIRSLAALFVVLDHAPTLFHLPYIPRWGHQAVIVFFVLSGYVISNVRDTRETTLRIFVIARLSRLWSVLIPALLITIACDVAGRTFGLNAYTYDATPIDYPIIRIAALVPFLSETWVSIQPLSNGVVWSLCAEFWYYMLFAAWSLVPPGRWRHAAIIGAGCLAGHKALLLLPIWLFGVALQRWRTLRHLHPIVLAALYLTSSLYIVWCLVDHAYNPAIEKMAEWIGPWAMTELAQARVFWFDWIFGLAVAAHFLGARALVSQFNLHRIVRPIRWCAGISFAAYLLHLPILTLTAAFLPKSAGILGIILTLLAIGLLGPPIETSKRWWRHSLTIRVNQIISFVSKRGSSTPSHA